MKSEFIITGRLWFVRFRRLGSIGVYQLRPIRRFMQIPYEIFVKDPLSEEMTRLPNA